MLANNQDYQKEQIDTAEMWLIYPRSEKFSTKLPDMKFDNGLAIKVLPFDAEVSRLLN